MASTRQGAALGAAVAHLADDVVLMPVSLLASPMTVKEAKVKSSLQISGLDPDIGYWQSDQWRVWECAGLGEVRLWGRVIFTFTSTHHGPPRFSPTY